MILPSDDYTAANSELIPWEKDRLYQDQDGILWINTPTITRKRSLQSFDGVNWTDYSNYPGFPQERLANIVKDDTGKLWVLDYWGNLYTLENNQFKLGRQEIFSHNSLEIGSGTCTVPAKVTATIIKPTNLIKIISAEGLQEEELWSQNYPVNLPTGSQETMEILTGKTLPAGAYEMKTTLYTPLNQELATGGTAFVVKETGLSINVFADCSSCGYHKARHRPGNHSASDQSNPGTQNRDQIPGKKNIPHRRRTAVIIRKPGPGPGTRGNPNVNLK